MANRQAYLFYEAGQAVAAAHLGLTIRHISPDPAINRTQIDIPADAHKARIILRLTGMAAEKKGLGKTDPLHRTRNRLRIRAELTAAAKDYPLAQRARAIERLHDQAQDRADTIAREFLPAIHAVADLLAAGRTVSGETVVEVVQKFKVDHRWHRTVVNPTSIPSMSFSPT